MSAAIMSAAVVPAAVAIIGTAIAAPVAALVLGTVGTLGSREWLGAGDGDGSVLGVARGGFDGLRVALSGLSAAHLAPHTAGRAMRITVALLAQGGGEAGGDARRFGTFGIDKRFFAAGGLVEAGLLKGDFVAEFRFGDFGGGEAFAFALRAGDRSLGGVRFRRGLRG